MTVGGIDHVYYWTRDMDRAVRFYVDVVGLRLIRREGDSWAEFAAGPIRFALHGAAEGHPVAPGGAAAAFSVDDLDLTLRTLEERGVHVTHAGEVAGFARFASFSDPDGNTVQLIELAGDAPGRGPEG